ncbi:MAG: ATP-binding protein [Deltaproteobacteria bacterium]|nr:ATP-binding protein [Deltaproteobacteria bacterium]
MEDNFADRDRELALLDGLWMKKPAQLVVAYGRRRIGKTALLDYFAKRRKLLHWIAYRSTSHELLSSFSQACYAFLHPGEPTPPDFTYGSWRVALDTLALHAEKQRVGIVIDEFPYLIEADPSIPSLLQAEWDKKLSRTRIFLALSGSRMGMMRDQILAPRGPLYGRSTALLHLEAIPITALHEFFPRFSPVALVEAYAVTGGVPKYFEWLHPHQPVLKSVETALHEQTTFLTAEPEFLLHEEFRETRIYLAILRTLGRRALEASAIAQVCGIDSKVLSRYLDQLMALKFVERRVPADQDPRKSRKGRYGIRDEFLSFFFHFIAPHLPDIERGRLQHVIRMLRKGFDAYVGRAVFERLCQDWVARQADAERLSFTPTAVGPYWDRTMQIDVLGISARERAMLVGECKWTPHPVGVEVADALLTKAKRLTAANDYHAQLMLFSRSGFTPALREAARKKHYQLVSLPELLKH